MSVRNSSSRRCRGAYVDCCRRHGVAILSEAGGGTKKSRRRTDSVIVLQALLSSCVYCSIETSVTTYLTL